MIICAHISSFTDVWSSCGECKLLTYMCWYVRSVTGLWRICRGICGLWEVSAVCERSLWGLWSQSEAPKWPGNHLRRVVPGKPARTCQNLPDGQNLPKPPKSRKWRQTTKITEISEIRRFRDRVYRPLFKTFHFSNDRPREGPILGSLCTCPHETVIFCSDFANQALFRFFTFDRFVRARTFDP